MELSILNRCGSAPGLPTYSPLSASVYNSSKKRTLQGSASGVSPFASLQSSRLTPLPADTRTKIDPLLKEKMCQDARTISYLKHRIVLLERDISASTKYRHTTAKQLTQLSLENQHLQIEKNQQQTRINELNKTVLRQQHEYDKLAARYSVVYGSLQKLFDQQNASDNSAQQSTLKTLARENQDFLRKQRVLEARHTEDKTLTSNQEKKIKRLKAEIEALRHMHEAKTQEGDFDDSTSDTDNVPRVTKLKKRTEVDGGRPNSPAAPVPITSSTLASTLGTTSHLVTAEAYQYIDPNILKVLEKVDSQFSITNAINLSVVLKKWLNSCVHIVCSTHFPTVLQTLLTRICELLHCEHAAVFTVDHATRKLIATCSEHGPEHWEFPLDKGIAGYAARHNLLCNVHCANDDPRFYSPTDSITSTTSREVLVLPIVHELQLYMESHISSNGDNSSCAKMNNLGVFAVLQAWNTTHQKPFSANDQIVGSLLAIQTGIILRQTAVTKTLQKINHKTHQILQISKFPGGSSIPSVVQLVAVAQKELAEILGIKQLRIFVLDATVHKLWHVGEHLSQDPSDNSSPTIIRRYVSAQASLCALLLRSDATSIVLPQPSAEANFNDTVDIPGGARGLYLAPILPPWGNGALPFGIVQVPRVAKARLSASPFAVTVSEGAGTNIAIGSVGDIAVNNEREAAQQTEDRLMLELLGLFCRVFAGLLHHVAAQQLYDTCPSEILQAQLATLTNHLEEKQKEIEDEENITHTANIGHAYEEDLLASSCQTRRHASVVVVPGSTSDSRNGRRVASADPKQRAASEFHRSTSSPIACPDPPRVVSDDDISYDEVSGTTQDEEMSSECFNDPVANDTFVATPANSGSSGNGDEDLVAKINIVGSNQLEQLALDLEQHSAEAAEQPTWSAVYDSMETNATENVLPPDDWITDDDNVTAEQLEHNVVGCTWEETSAYVWPAGENVAATWEYGAVDEGALATEDEDGPSGREGRHTSTDSSYNIDLHWSSRTTSAETNQPL
ncbi:hypothetical protein PHMEG_0009250 [Phytophthora megakarya]|uniref:GAF domain-containing protein n=1 Tax=Phytophthora megakarya TaxID=4795 RepID=A0A225WH04_9STRA|nr:hypothetical protein PHMEG_0009250 [Phytophthora megakarya]